MRVISMTVDKRPSDCLFCPLNSPMLKHKECGKKITRKIEGGWEETTKVPDERCLIHEIGGD